MLPGAWKSVLLDIDRDTEFVGDDVDQYSKLVDLGAPFEFVTVIVPTITSSTTGVCIQKTPNIDEVPSPVHILDDDATGSFLHATSAAVTALAVIFRIGAVQYVRIKMGANQAADRTFYVRGFNRG